MAYFYDHIKGLNQPTTNAASVTSVLTWTSNIPTLEVNNTKYGAFVMAGDSTSPLSQDLYNSYVFTRLFYTNGISNTTEPITTSGLKTSTIYPKESSNKIDVSGIWTSSSSWKATINDLTATKCTLGNSNYNITVDTANTNAIKVKGPLIIDGSDGYCSAPYFNATSDKRAKEDIVLLTINAVDFINSLNIYSFRYKDSKQSSIGIMAQDVKDYSIPNSDFSLVSNSNASGENGDYMQIKEDKLIYILMKAIQEQQAQIDELKEALNHAQNQ